MTTDSAIVQSASPDRQAQCAMFGTRGATPSGGTKVSAVPWSTGQGMAMGVIFAW